MYKLITYSDELYHYGVLGMKWGVRRYQNYDGTRIGTGGAPVVNKAKVAGNTVSGGQGGKAKGLARLAATANTPSEPKEGENTGEKKQSFAEKAFTPSIKQGKGKEDVSPAEKIAKNTARGLDSASKIAEFGEKHDKSTKQKNEEAREKQLNKAKKMSDKELRDSINRIKMEREYASLTTKETESGWTKAKEILSEGKEVIELAGTIISIISTIMMIKAMKGGGLKQSDTSAEEESLMHLLELGGFDDEFCAHAMALDVDYVEDYLEHHGVKGMKWGVRRYQNYDGTRIKTGSGENSGKSLKDYAYIDFYSKDPATGKRKIQFSDHMPEQAPAKKLARAIKDSVAGGQGGKAEGNERLAAKTSSNPNRAEMNEALKQKTQQHVDLAKAVGDWVTRPINERLDVAEKQVKEGKDLVDKLINKEFDASKLAASAKTSKPRADGKDESKFTKEEKRISKDAKKDAEEFARAKAFYGEGAGNRRKAIKTTVESKKSKNPFYAEEFEYHLSQQDMEEHMRKAKMERSQKDTFNNTRKGLNKANRALGQLSRYL